MDMDNNSVGGGSGGDTGQTDQGNQVKTAKHTYQIGGNQVVLVSRKPAPAPGDDESKPDASRIVLLAGGSVEGGFIDDGTVDVRGCKGVRISAGPLPIPMISPMTSQESTNGVDVLVAETQKITLRRGLTPEVDQRIEISQDNILIDAGILGTLTLCAGLSTITIDLSGITIVGLPFVQINPGPPPPCPPPPEEDVPLPPLPPGEAYA
jgi:hypothetical protein